MHNQTEQKAHCGFYMLKINVRDLKAILRWIKESVFSFLIWQEKLEERKKILLKAAQR